MRKAASACPAGSLFREGFLPFPAGPSVRSKLMKNGARASEYENAIQRLVTAHLIYQVYRAEQIRKPMENYKDIDDFKVYLADMGMLCAQKDVRPNHIFFMEQEELEDFKGGLTENYVFCQLMANGFRPFFWKNGRETKEIDCIINLKGSLIPVEVRSSENTVSESLKEYMKLYKPDFSIRISGKNFGMEGGIRSIPLYAAFCLNADMGSPFPCRDDISIRFYRYSPDGNC